MFKLNETLAKDTLEICTLKLCKVLLMNDQNYPWIILVPKIEGLQEFHRVPPEHQLNLMSDITITSDIVEKHFTPKTLNVAALGNIVSQLHIHIVARFETDPCWPDPIWGKKPRIPYAIDQADELLLTLQNEFSKT